MSPANFNADGSEAYGLMGYIGGFAAKVQTSAYMNAVLAYSHARLAGFFDEWFDAKAKAEPHLYQHVFEWPSEFQKYSETVGNPADQLWEHTFSGTGKSATASFVFLPSKRPVPVDPILLEEGPGGQVKEGIHIFTWKAMAFEYGAEIKVAPTLAKFLAYVGRDYNMGGSDAGWHHANTHEGGQMVNLSRGPVHFIAGGGKTTLKFTTAYILWWQTMANSDFYSRIAPELQADLISQAQLDKAIKLGAKSSKTVSMTAQASRNEATFSEASRLALADLTAKEVRYIKAAAARRRMALYGE